MMQDMRVKHGRPHILVAYSGSQWNTTTWHGSPSQGRYKVVKFNIALTSNSTIIVHQEGFLRLVHLYLTRGYKSSSLKRPDGLAELEWF